MTIEELIAECTAYDYKEALEEKKPKSWLKSVSATRRRRWSRIRRKGSLYLSLRPVSL